MAHTEAHDPTKELGYLAKRSGLYMAGKGAAEAVGETLAESQGGQMLGLSTMLGGSAAGLVTVGLAAGVSATLTQMDYIHRKDNIKDMYKEEIAARLHKPLNKISREDLDTVAKENAVLGDELRQIKKQRTFGVAMSFVASMAALSVVILALPAIAGAVATAAAGTAVTGAAAMHSLGWGGALALKAITGLITYNAVKHPLHHVADKLFDLDYSTTHDHIVSLKRDQEAGRTITREQVLSVYASAHPTLDHMIKREYGKKFDALSPDQKSLVAVEMAKLIPLDKIATDINSDKVNVTELAFAVEGQISGVQNGRPVEEKTGLVNALFTGIKNTFRVKTTIERDPTHERISAIASETTTMTTRPEGMGNHVQRLGRAPLSADLAHVERIDQQREQQQLATQQV
jgi:hypothetical protein